MLYLCGIRDLKNELVSHNYVTTFMKIKGSPLPDVISRSGDLYFVYGVAGAGDKAV